MYLSNYQRVAKLAATLVRQPHYLPRYLKALPIWKRLPVDLAVPWWSFAAIDFITEQCQPHFEVFEYGTGGSTILFAKQCKKVTAVEDDAAWQRVVEKALDTLHLSNASLVLRPFNFQTPGDFENSAYLQALAESSYDIIVLDGQDFTGEIRPICFQRAEAYIKKGGMIIVDDSWRYPQLRQTCSARSVRTFESVGPYRVGVTSTDVYFY